MAGARARVCMLRPVGHDRQLLAHRRGVGLPVGQALRELLKTEKWKEIPKLRGQLQWEGDREEMRRSRCLAIARRRYGALTMSPLGVEPRREPFDL